MFAHFNSCTVLILISLLLKETVSANKESEKIEKDLCIPGETCGPNGDCGEAEDSDYGCICHEGYEGEKCENIIWCLQNPVCPDNCNFDKDLKTGFCNCSHGMYFDFSSRKCKEISSCIAISCKKNERCVDGGCDCIDNYSKDTSGTCLFNKSSCENLCNGKNFDCVEIPENPGEPLCTCKENFFYDGQDCKDSRCTVPRKTGCSQECSIDNNDVKCNCTNGFKLMNDQKTCDFENENDKCESLKCNIGNCIKKESKEVCICPPGYVAYKNDTGCEVNIQLLCATKKLNESTGRCICKGKYKQAKDGFTCEKRNMCEDEEIKTKCQKKGGICVDTKDFYKCGCPKGYAEDASNEGKCTPLCHIPENIKKCSHPNQECFVEESNGILIPSCKCLPTFSSKTSEDDKCSTLAAYSYTIKFLPILKNSYEKEEIHGKLVKDIKLSMAALYPNLRSSEVLECKQEMDLLLCAIELQFETEPTPDNLERFRLSNTCLVLENISEKFCILPPELPIKKDLIDNISVQKTNRCDEEIKLKLCGKYAICQQFKNNFVCTCDEGFENFERSVIGESIMTYCEDIDECKRNHSCVNNSECVNTVGDYFCKCNDGYFKPPNKRTTLNKDGCIEICSKGVCGKGTCEIIDEERICNCPSGYSGPFCNKIVSDYEAATHKTKVVGVVLGILLALAVIAFSIIIWKLKKNRHSRHPFAPTRSTESTEMTERRQFARDNRGYQ